MPIFSLVFVSRNCFCIWMSRIDPIKLNRTQIRGSLPAVTCAFAFLFYAVAMVVNLVMMQTEDYLRMTQYGNSQTNQTLTIVC